MTAIASRSGLCKMHTHIHTCTRTYTDTHRHTQTHTHTHKHTHLRTHRHRHSHTQTHIDTNTDTHTHRPRTNRNMNRQRISCYGVCPHVISILYVIRRQQQIPISAFRNANVTQSSLQEHLETNRQRLPNWRLSTCHRCFRNRSQNPLP